MCGIAGIVSNKLIDLAEIKLITDSMIHRGPDDAGYKICNHHNEVFCALGQRRLSIIDLSDAGHQPMSNEDRSLWITFNGEIYNFQILKNDLLEKGHIFHSNTDTEVIIHGYEEYGTDFFNRMNGMFAFAIWDNSKGELILVRDRFGKKPLHYWIINNRVCFSSELKALILDRDFRKELDYTSLSKYLAFEYVPAPFTIFQDVRKLPQGSWLKLKFKQKEIQMESDFYWKIDFQKNKIRTASLTQTEIEHELIDLLKKSIQRRLMSDVPLGVFLSGGIDSSSIVALLAEMMNPRKIKTFSIGFEDKSFNESSYAAKIASIFKTDHHEQILTLQTMLNILPEITQKLDEPFADASIIPTYLLSKFTREHVTVALGGDGGDELFAGYDPFLAHYWADYYQIMPRFIHEKIIHPLAKKIPVSTANMSFDFKVKHFLKGVYNEPFIRNQIWLGAFSQSRQNELLSSEVQSNITLNPYEQIRSEKNNHQFTNSIEEIAFMYQKFYLPDDILVKIDRASMLNSLEARTPFLDVDFAEFANALPSNLKMKGTTRKYILKKALTGRLPDSILCRNKKGFGIPLAKWIKEDLRKEIVSVFEPEKIIKMGIFNSAYIQSLLKKHFSGKEDNRKEIWTLFMFMKWHAKFMD